MFADSHPLNLVVFLLALHWVADFVCQSHWMASNKSRNPAALGLHIITYGMVLAVGTVVVFGFNGIVGFLIINILSHFAVDLVTSRITSVLWQNQRWHDFFVVIGIDQLLHTSILVLSLRLLVG